jgi:hypothetical protein
LTGKRSATRRNSNPKLSLTLTLRQT